MKKLNRLTVTTCCLLPLMPPIFTGAGLAPAWAIPFAGLLLSIADRNRCSHRIFGMPISARLLRYGTLAFAGSALRNTSASRRRGRRWFTRCLKRIPSFYHPVGGALTVAGGICVAWPFARVAAVVYPVCWRWAPYWPVIMGTTARDAADTPIDPRQRTSPAIWCILWCSLFSSWAMPGGRLVTWATRPCYWLSNGV